MIRVSFTTWNEKRTYKYIMKRIWWGRLWTPFIRVEYRLPQATYK